MQYSCCVKISDHASVRDANDFPYCNQLLSNTCSGQKYAPTIVPFLYLLPGGMLLCLGTLLKAGLTGGCIPSQVISGFTLNNPVRLVHNYPFQQCMELMGHHCLSHVKEVSFTHPLFIIMACWLFLDHLRCPDNSPRVYDCQSQHISF